MSEPLPPSAIASRHLFDIGLRLRAPFAIGVTPAGERTALTVLSGSFSGTRIRGDVVPEGSSNLLLRRSDGSFTQNARLLLRTHDDALISLAYVGVQKGEYFRTTPLFETGAPQYAWLNSIVSVGVGSRKIDTEAHRIFEIL